jgi:hypothetical protein
MRENDPVEAFVGAPAFYPCGHRAPRSAFDGCFGCVDQDDIELPVTRSGGRVDLAVTAIQAVATQRARSSSPRARSASSLPAAICFVFGRGSANPHRTGLGCVDAGRRSVDRLSAKHQRQSCLGLILLTTLCSPILTPIVLDSVGFVTTGDYSDDPNELAANGAGGFLAVWVILLSLCMLTHWILGEKRVALISPCPKLSNYLQSTSPQAVLHVARSAI